MQKKMKILYSGFRDPAHSSGGGYDRIANSDCGNRSLLANNYPGGQRFRTHWMRVATSLLDLHTRLIRRRYDIVHLYYGELTMLPLPYRKSRKHKSVITLHLDIELRRDKNLFVKLLRNFDGIVTLSTQQQQQLKKRYGLESKFIPHGFDLPTFERCEATPVDGEIFDASKINLITIGSNYRDFDTLETVIRHFHNDSRFRFHLVGIPAEIKQRLKGLPNALIYPRLNDNQYYSLIEKCDYNLLPLTFATANNTLLEAQALGVKSILPKIDGISDYGAPAPLNNYYSSPAHLIEIINKLDKSSTQQPLIEYNHRFSWEKIRREMDCYYKNL